MLLNDTDKKIQLDAIRAILNTNINPKQQNKDPKKRTAFEIKMARELGLE